MEVLPLRPNIHLVAGAGGNVTVQIGDDGVLVVDTGSVATAPATLAAIRRITQAPIRYVIDTSADVDHAGGNALVAAAGQSFGIRPNEIPFGPGFSSGAAILAPQSLFARMSTATAGVRLPEAAWPTETFEGTRRYMFINGEGIEVLHQPAAHTDSDSFVFFRRSDVVAAGDVLDTTRFPVIDTAAGGSIDGEIDALNRLMDLAIPSVPIISREAGTLVIPGHGRICNQFDVVAYRDMVTIIRDRVRDMKRAGMSLEQVRAAAPAKGYVGRYGSDSGTWTTGAFVDAVYRTVRTGAS
jgi:glyoxylase-like metal-dependent hydrolase (beta-lactamase superfamily II)